VNVALGTLASDPERGETPANLTTPRVLLLCYLRDFLPFVVARLTNRLCAALVLASRASV
jgi:hypothetical protein